MTSKIKAVQRNNAVKNEGTIYKNPAFITTKDMIDVKQALYETKIINYNSTPMFINYNKDQIKKINKKSKKMFRNHFAIDRKLHDVKLARFIENGKLDYFFCDLCGNFTAKNAWWFYKHSNHFSDGCRLPLTIQVLNRKKSWQKAVLSVTENSKKHLLPEVRKMMDMTQDTGFFALSDKLTLNLITQLNALYLSMPDKRIELRSITIYKNSDINYLAKEMAYFDIILYNQKFDRLRYGKFLNCIKNYQRTTSTVIIPKRKRRKRKHMQKPLETYAQRLGIRTKRDLKKLQFVGVKAAITRLANKEDTLPGRIIGGIKREITERYKKVG